MKYVKTQQESLDINSFNDLLNLFAQSFPLSKTKLKKIFSLVLNSIPYKSITLINFEKSIAGALILVDRKIWFKNINLSVCGMSFMAKNKNYNDIEISNLLIKTVLNESESKDVSIGFASKKMDYYWYRYGFVGVTNFSEFHFDIDKYFLIDDNKEYSYENADKDDLIKLNIIYEKTYRSISCSFLRDDLLWRYHFKKHSDTLNFIKIIHKSKIVGYFVHKENKIYEFAFLHKIQRAVVQILKNYFISLNKKEIIFYLSFKHPLLLFLKNFSHKKFEKYVHEGGHVIRINDIKNFLNKIKPEIEKSLIEQNIMKYHKKIDGVLFEYSKKNLNISFDPSFQDNNISKRNITKFIFGLKKDTEMDSIISPDLSINFSIIDQF